MTAIGILSIPFDLEIGNQISRWEEAEKYRLQSTVNSS